MKYFHIRLFSGKDAVVPQIEEESRINEKNGKKLFQLANRAKPTDYVSYFEGSTQIVSTRYFEIIKSYGYPQSSEFWESIELVSNKYQIQDYILLNPPIITLDQVDFSMSKLIAIDMLRRFPNEELFFSSKEEYQYYIKTKDRMSRIRIKSIRVLGKLDSPWVKTHISNSYNFLTEEIASQIQKLKLSGIDIDKKVFVQDE